MFESCFRFVLEDFLLGEVLTPCLRDFLFFCWVGWLLMCFCCSLIVLVIGKNIAAAFLFFP